MPTDLWFWILASVASFLVGASKGGVPMVAVIGVLLLAQVMSPILAAGLLLPIYIVSDVMGLWLYRNNYNTRIIKIVLPAAAMGVLIGWATASYTSDAHVKLIIGAIGIWYGIDMLLKWRRSERPPQPADVPRGMFWGTLAGFTSFIIHAGGTPYQMYVLPQRLDKMIYAGTITIVFAIVNLMKVPPYWLLGQLNVGSLKVCAILSPLALLGAYLGFRVVKLMPEKLFFRIVEATLFVLSVKLAYEGLTSLY
jgi:uncharacterized protein